MALDICFDVKTFLERTCRACSRYFSDDATEEKIKFHRIFAEAPQIPLLSTSLPNHAAEEQRHEEKSSSSSLLEYEALASVTKPSEEMKEIYEELLIWKLNIKASDGLPQQICNDCMERFRSVKHFREECLDTQKVLESYFKDFDSLLETYSLGRQSPKNAESLKSETAPVASPAPSSFNAEDLVEEVPESPEHQPTASSPCDSPKLRLSPRFYEAVYAESSMGTPPPLFEEIKTEPIDVQTMEDIKTEAELQLEITAQLQQQQQDLKKDAFTPEVFGGPLAKTPPLPVHYSSSDDESSTPTSDEDDDDDDDDDDEHEPNLASDSDFDVPPGEYNRSHSNIVASNPLQCKICFAAFAKRSLLKEHHLRSHPQEKPYACDICTSTFKSNFLLTQHKLKHNRPDSIQCTLCAKYFRSQLHLQRHAKNFHLTSTYTCHICHEKFENYTQIRFQYHVRQHGEKRFHCQFCDKSFHQKIHAINHERTHTKVQPFRCDICGKTYRQQTACQEHMLTHADPKPFKCKICEKGFAQRSSLRLHYRTHSAKFHCELCGQNFAQKVHYEMHQLTHGNGVGGRAHTCAYCGKSFSLETSLNAHLKTHAQTLKTYKCQYCDKSFAKKPLQMLHEQQHKQETAPRFECSFCSETFLYRSSLGQHMISHLERARVNDELMDFSDYSFNAAL